MSIPLIQTFPAEKLICETIVYNLSTQSSSGIIKNVNPDYKSCMEYFIPDLIINDENISHVNFSIPYVCMPNSFYIVSEYSNTLIVLQNGVTTTYTFTTGIYNATSFITAFNATMGTGWSITLDQTAYKYTISHTTYDFTFLTGSTIDYILGFTGNISSSAKTLVMPRLCNFLPLPRILMHCPELGFTNGLLVSNTNSNASDIILSIPNLAKSGGQIIYESDVKYLLSNENLQKLTICFTDENANLINFNGIATYFTLQFDIYKKYIEKPPPFRDLVNKINSSNAFEEYNQTMRENNILL